MNYQDLISDHDRIDALTAKLEIAVQAENPEQTSAVMLLGDLERLVAAHLDKEDSFIYPDLVRSRDPADAASLVVEFESLKQDWGSYLAVWREGVTADEWLNFQASTLGMLQRLRERVMKETGLLYSLALREGMITMKA